MIKRRIQKEIESSIARNPAVALMGPRQVGKTTLALGLADLHPSIYLDLEKQRDLTRITDIEIFHAENREKLIILDEVHRAPEIFAPLRGIIDDERRRGNNAEQFLFLGSASIDLLKQSSETLAGRIAYIELHPVDALEYLEYRSKEDPDLSLNQLWLRGGFPRSLLAAAKKESFEWRENFLKTYLERDIPQLGPRIPAETLRRFWTMLAHRQGGVLNASQLAGNLSVSGTTVARYLDLMVDLLLVRRLQPWSSNTGKRLIRSPKVYVRDSGIVHTLLHIQTINDLLGHPVVGGSWEGFVIENILSATPGHIIPFFYGTPGGAEIDLLLEFPNQEKWAIEIKRSSTPSLSKGFYTACADVDATRRFVVYAGQDRFSMGHGTTAISLNEMMNACQGLANG
ncbi:MAG TPA: ATP-binding protein [Gammaproteobacteria bacterium]|nr:ATP-binding protein [Gammaproteobacteria bacterium]